MGDVPSLANTESVILRLLIAAGRKELYGLELVKKSDGELKRGTVYVTLNRMEEKGFLESREEEEAKDYIGIRRRLYKVTGLGQRALAAREMVESFMLGDGLVQS